MEHLEFRSAGTSAGALRCLAIEGGRSSSSSGMSEGALRCLLVKDLMIVNGCSRDGRDGWGSVDELPISITCEVIRFSL